MDNCCSFCSISRNAVNIINFCLLLNIMNKRGNEGSDETSEKQYLWIAYLVFAIMIFLAAADFIKSNASKESFGRDIQSKELATITDLVASSPRAITITYKNECCEYEFKEGRVYSSLPSDVIQKNYPIISSSDSIKSSSKLKGTLILTKDSGGLKVDEQKSRL